VLGHAFGVGDSVLCRIQSNKNHHKLAAPWEGPYIIAEVLQPGTYKLKTNDDNAIANA